MSTSLVENDKPLKLEIVEHRPAGSGPFPLLIINHGSTGSGANKNQFGATFAPASVTDYFTAKGWMVIYPQRRGRGRSEGTYDEGFNKSRTHYSCDPKESLTGLERAIEDLDAVMAFIATREYVQQDAILISGVSRGGVLAIAYAGHRPAAFVAAINFSGGWLGKKCAQTYQQVNRLAFTRAAVFTGPSLWLYGRNDAYYGIRHCRDNFDSYCAAGGQGRFLALTASHDLLFKPQIWRTHLDEFLGSLESGVTKIHNSNT
ncbi:MAG: alpha/beta hydrolase [Granulosicoccus sp.]|nr:alpha/beta hydrolase [Granulosicoccus sp.]